MLLNDASTASFVLSSAGRRWFRSNASIVDVVLRAVVASLEHFVLDLLGELADLDLLLDGVLCVTMVDAEVVGADVVEFLDENARDRKRARSAVSSNLGEFFS